MMQELEALPKGQLYVTVTLCFGRWRVREINTTIQDECRRYKQLQWWWGHRDWKQWCRVTSRSTKETRARRMCSWTQEGRAHKRAAGMKEEYRWTQKQISDKLAIQFAWQWNWRNSARLKHWGNSSPESENNGDNTGPWPRIATVW